MNGRNSRGRLRRESIPNWQKLPRGGETIAESEKGSTNYEIRNRLGRESNQVEWIALKSLKSERKHNSFWKMPVVWVAMEC